MKKRISIIATFRNEEENINEFIKRINSSFKKFSNINYELIFIDDFSDDLSNALIKKACIKNKKIKLITLKKKYGHNASMQTGFDFVSKKNYAAVIDCDLQDQPELIAKNFSKIKKEQTLHFVRKKREDNFFQRLYTKIAYLILYYISQGKIIRISKVVLRLFETVGVKVGPSLSKLETIPFRTTSSLLSTPVDTLLACDKEIEFDGDYESDGFIVIKQDQPLPCSILAIYPTLVTSDG